MENNKHRIAIITDSGTDVPPEAIKEYKMYVAPLIVRYQDSEYEDRVDISPEDIYNRLEQEIPKTSLPRRESVLELFRRIEMDGFDQVLIVSISGGLSGTGNMLRLTAEEFPGLECRLVDTKNIGIGAGLTVLYAAELVAAGHSMDEIEAELNRTLKQTHVYFCLATLEYLKKGGRIGYVTATLGRVLDLKPVISCNSEGIYDTVQRSRGRKKSLRAAIELTEEHALGSLRCRIAVAHGNAKAEMMQIFSALKDKLPGVEIFDAGQISPALVVHTGPGLVGVAVQRLD